MSTRRRTITVVSFILAALGVGTWYWHTHLRRLPLVMPSTLIGRWMVTEMVSGEPNQRTTMQVDPGGWIVELTPEVMTSRMSFFPGEKAKPETVEYTVVQRDAASVTIRFRPTHGQQEEVGIPMDGRGRSLRLLPLQQMRQLRPHGSRLGYLHHQRNLKPCQNGR